MTENELKVIYIPCGIRHIGRDIFAEGASFEIRFEGTAEDWNAIDKQTDMEDMTVVFCADYPRIPKKTVRLPFIRLKKNREGEK